MSASNFALIKEMLESAESNIRSAKQILNELLKENGDTSYTSKASNVGTKVIVDNSKVQIVEGIFNGQSMTGPDGKNYPIPANYASKSKIVPGDILKLTITEDGSFLYKQIGPIERKKIIGVLTYEDGQYKVLANSKAYKVLLASVTYFKGEIGDSVTLIIPALEESEWGAIENIIPKVDEATELE